MSHLFRTALVAGLGCLLSLQTLVARDVRRIAIVRDDDSAYFDSVIKGFEAELKTLASDNYRFELVDTYNARGNPDQLPTLFLQALDDPGIDVVYAAGVISSRYGQNIRNETRRKPVVAGAMEFSSFAQGSISDSGTSAIPNFTFIAEARRVEADLSELSRIAESKRIHVLFDQAVLRSLGEELAADALRIKRKLGVDIVFVPTAETVTSAMSRLPKSATAVYVPILQSLRRGERAKIFEELAGRKLISLSMLGDEDVRSGALAGLAADDSLALHRRTASNIHQVFSEISTALLPVYLKSNDQLMVNMRTAKRIGWAPGYETLISAELINLDAIQTYDADLSIEKAMGVAADKNTNVRLSRAQLSADYWETEGIRTGLRPQVSINGNWGKEGISNRISQSTTEANTDSFVLGAEISQILYSDRLTSAIRANREVEAASKLDLESVELDSMQSAGLAFINCLLADALFDVEKENLLLASQNLNLARTRRDIGSAEPSEVFRWLSEYAAAKSQVIQQDAERKNSRVSLNVSLGQRAGTNYRLQDISLPEGDLYFMAKELEPLVSNLDQVDQFVEFVKSFAVWSAPEIDAFNRNMAQQGILLRERNRRSFLPEVTLSAGLNQLLTESSQNYDSQTEWTVGIGFSIPLYEGGLRKTETERIGAVIRQLEAQRDGALFLVEQSALTSGYSVVASHPSVRLTRNALEASERNYASVSEKYSRGAADVLDLIDAQSDLIEKRRNAATAKYGFLADTIDLQRSMAWFEFNKTPEERARWTRMLRNHLESGSLHIQHIK